MAIYSTAAVEIFGRGVSRSEGVVVDKEDNVYGAGRGRVVYKVDPDGNVSEICTLPSGSIPNGVTMDRKGNLIVCDLGKEAVLKIDRSGKISLVANRVGTLALTLPNFASYDADGNLYVSNSSTCHLDSAPAELANPQPNGAVVRIRPDGRSEIVATGLYMANGTAIDPKEEAIYVLETTRNDCMRIEIKRDGTFGKPEVYSDGFPAFPDGMAFAADGTLVVTLPGYLTKGEMSPANMILVADTNGKWTKLIDDASGQRLSFPTNCAFGGPGLQDLYFANLEGDHFSRLHTTFKGHPLYHQR